MSRQSVVRPALTTALLLLVPLIAMQLTDEVNWDETDFIAAGALLCSTGLAYELLARRTNSTAYRAAAGIAVLATLLLIWINLAVGIIGSEDTPVNLMYYGVPAVGVIAAAIGRLKPQGMARALSAMALAQALVTTIAPTLAKPPMTSVESLAPVVALNALFVAIFLESAFLFRRAGVAMRALHPGS